MCSIAGITSPETQWIEKMNTALSHRGPDGSGIWNDTFVALGHNRLAIIDTSNAGAQPMHSVDGRFVIVFNGEIYNYQELRSSLRNYPFRTQTDTEVIIAAYQKWGEDSVQHLDGIFAFGIWDRQEKKLFLARDHMGVKPLFYTVTGGTLAFASEPGALYDLTERKIEPEALVRYLQLNYEPAPDSLVRGVHKLPPGHSLTFKDNQLVIKVYLKPSTKTGGSVGLADIVTTIGASVQRQLVSDRPVGMFLSGGIDSSVVLYHASQAVERMKTYSVGYEMIAGSEEQTAQFNSDADIAKLTAKKFNAEHKSFTITLEDIRKNLLPSLLCLDEPVANPTSVAQYLLAKWVREEGIVVALGGDGGDELFGGYTRHRALMSAYAYQKIPSVLKAPLEMFYPRAKKLNTPFGTAMHCAVLARSVGEITPYVKTSAEFNDAALAYFTAQYASEDLKGRHPIDVFMQIDRQTWLSEESLARTDRTSMAHGLEVRVPLLGREVVDLADRISVYRKIAPLQAKRVLRQAYKPHLPSYLFSQPKRGWISPGAKWLRDPEILAQVKGVCSDSYYDGLSAFIDWEKVQQKLDDHVHKRAYNLYPLWNILGLQVWAKLNNITL